MIIISKQTRLFNGRKEMFYLTTQSTHLILWLYGVGLMVKDHSDTEIGNLLPTHGLLFPILFNETRQYNIHIFDKTIFLKCKTRQIKATENQQVTFSQCLLRQLLTTGWNEKYLSWSTIIEHQ